MRDHFPAVTFPVDQDELAQQVVGDEQRRPYPHTHIVAKHAVGVPDGRANDIITRLRALGVNAHLVHLPERTGRDRGGDDA